MDMGHSHETSACKGPKTSDYAQKSADIGKVFIKLWYSSVEKHWPRSFKILAMAVGQTFLKKKNLQNLLKFK